MRVQFFASFPFVMIIFTKKTEKLVQKSESLNGNNIQLFLLFVFVQIKTYFYIEDGYKKPFVIHDVTIFTVCLDKFI